MAIWTNAATACPRDDHKGVVQIKKVRVCSAFMLEGACEHLNLAFQVFQLEDFTVCCPVESNKKKGSSAGLKDATQDRDNVQKEEVGDGCDVEESGHSLEGFGVAQEGASSSSRYQPELEKRPLLGHFARMSFSKALQTSASRSACRPCEHTLAEGRSRFWSCPRM